ncbi:type II CAAX endopeptidase family protein [Kineococcus sp. NUM-3379]
MKVPAPLPAGLDRRLLVWEVVAVLAVSLGARGVRALVTYVGAVTAPEPMSAQRATVLGSWAPDRPWLDLAHQLVSVAVGLAPVVLVAYLLARSGESLRHIGFDRSRPAGDLGRGLALAAAIGSTGLVFYLATVALGINRTVVASALPEVWWAVPVQVLAAAQNGILEEVLVAGFLLHRLAQLGVGRGRALVVSALLRGSYHLYQGAGGFLGNVLMGFVFGWLYQRWGRCMPLVVAHTAIDVGAFVGFALLAGRVDWLPS